MTKLAVISDAHLLSQAELVQDERQRTAEGEEALENFSRACAQVARTKPEGILLAGDMFDERTHSYHWVVHREAEKYMIETRKILEELANECSCQLYALRGNHDSDPVLKSLTEILHGKFNFIDDTHVEVAGCEVHFMTTHYQKGNYDIPDLPKVGRDLLLMHESIPEGIQGLPEVTIKELCSRFRMVLNGHHHYYRERALQIPNLCLLPALIPSREIKGNWILQFEWDCESGRMKLQTQPSPFGFVLLEGDKTKFERYDPKQVVVSLILRNAKTAQDYINGLKSSYDELSSRHDRDKLSIWIRTDADPLIVRRLLWPQVGRYDLHTIDILSDPHRRALLLEPSKQLASELQRKAYNRDELVDQVLSSLHDELKAIASVLFEKIFTSDRLRLTTHNTLDEFIELVDAIPRDTIVSPSFPDRVRQLAKIKGEK
jgi:predicted phosphodiesterase